MRQFQLSDTQICVSPLQWGEKQDWFAFITPKSRAYVTERDLVQLETFQRENLTVLSSMDAFVSSVAGVLKERPHEDPFLIRTLYGIGNGLAEIIKRSLASLQQIVLHRRDMSLWYSSLRSKHVASLRHAPVLGATFVFPPDLVREVSESRQEDIKSKALFKAATAGTSAPKQSSSFSGPQPKRQSSGADKVRSPKRSRGSSEEGQLVYPAAPETSCHAGEAQGPDE